MNQLVEDLMGTKAVLIRDGWTKGATTDAAGRHCITGAMQSYFMGHDGSLPERRYQETYHAIHRTLTHNWDVPPGFGVESWNDSIASCFQHILAVLDETINIALGYCPDDKKKYDGRRARNIDPYYLVIAKKVTKDEENEKLYVPEEWDSKQLISA